jgi:dTDP-glucose 4,6-dehydratase
MRKLTNILVTGGAGFIGSNFIRLFLTKKDFSGKIINLDKLTYAGNLENLKDLENDPRYSFIHGDICDSPKVNQVFSQYNIDTVVHFAAESHVDRSIHGPAPFIQTNILGPFTLLEAAKQNWKDSSDKLFHHISTDEVYGSLGPTGYFTEETPYDPRSPYSASKASSDHLVKAYFHTYQLPITISNCSNNFGPYQFPEKLIPLTIINALDNRPIPVYGDGLNIRDWIYVDDHNEAVRLILQKGRLGETYNIGGENELTNLALVTKICELLNKNPKDLITFVSDRKGHDRRYAIDCIKLKKELNWRIEKSFKERLLYSLDWYLNNQKWTQNISNGEYQRWLKTNYLNPLYSSQTN